MTTRVRGNLDVGALKAVGPTVHVALEVRVLSLLWWFETDLIGVPNAKKCKQGIW